MAREKIEEPILEDPKMDKVLKGERRHYGEAAASLTYWKKVYDM